MPARVNERIASPGSRYPFERQSHFCVDLVDSTPARLVFNRTVSLSDSHAPWRGWHFSTPDPLT